jgi:hypothetical protein
MRGGPRCYAAPIRLVATLDFVLARAAPGGFPALQRLAYKMLCDRRPILAG